ncbi:HAD-IA family hydrolase [Aestuariibacter salexigens]|uniref:HAD-IA family hydrolase n=1 Tax=Aestuariibacter salexigens TaxID=226010 RepID=UPI0003F79E14|nr:HAD-IA family hydrolase [Aestuariibacter salexigens]
MRFYRRVGTVKAMTFDLDDTLYDNLPYMLEAEAKLLAYLHEHFPATAQTSLKHWRSVRDALLTSRPELNSDMGELRRLTLLHGLTACGYDNTEAEHGAQQCFDVFYHYRSNFTVDKNICSLLSTLAERIPLVAITNGNVDLSKIGIADFFHTSFHANLKHPMKPHPMMFDLSAELLRLSPSDILHIGDNLEKDVSGAINAGFRSAWFACNRPMDLHREQVSVLPDVVLDDLSELLQFV